MAAVENIYKSGKQKAAEAAPVKGGGGNLKAMGFGPQQKEVAVMDHASDCPSCGHSPAISLMHKSALIAHNEKLAAKAKARMGALESGDKSFS